MALLLRLRRGVRFLDDREIQRLALDAQSALDAIRCPAAIRVGVAQDLISVFLQREADIDTRIPAARTRALARVPAIPRRRNLDRLPLLAAPLVPDDDFVSSGRDA